MGMIQKQEKLCIPGWQHCFVTLEGKYFHAGIVFSLAEIF